MSPPITSSTVAPLSSVLRFVALFRQRPGAVDDEEQVAALLFGQDIVGGVVHRQMIGGHHDHGVAEIGRAFDLVDQRGDVLLAAGHRAQRAVFFILPGVTLLLQPAEIKPSG